MLLLKTYGKKLFSKSCKWMKPNHFTRSYVAPVAKTHRCTYTTKTNHKPQSEINKCTALIESFLKRKVRNADLSNNRNEYCTKSKEEEEDLCLEKEARYKYHEDIEKAVNKQIISEFGAAYSYLSVSCHFGRTNIGLLGTQNFFKTMYQEELKHAMKLINYQQIRGGKVQLTPVPVGGCPECTIQKSLAIALTMEKSVADILFELLVLAKKHNDIRTQDFITREFLNEQIQCIRNVGNLLTTATRLNSSGVDQFLLDKELYTAVGHTITKI